MGGVGPAMESVGCKSIWAWILRELSGHRLPSRIPYLTQGGTLMQRVMLYVVGFNPLLPPPGEV